jgi:branched-subunit amino acid ABC-type transport system permease component
MNILTQSLFSGLISGAVYALLATGLVLAYRTSGVPNLAHGETFAVAGLATAAMERSGTSLLVAVPVALALAVAVSVAVEVLLLRPRRSWSLTGLVLVTLAFGFFSRGVLILLFGSDPLSFSSLVGLPPLRLLGGALPAQGTALILASLTACAGVALLLTRTPLGRQLRASAINPDAAQLLGVNVAGARILAFGLAGALGGLAAVLLVPLTSVDFQSGLGMTLRGFIAAALAGMSEKRAIWAGFTLGIVEAVVSGYVGALFQDPIVFAGLIVVALLQARSVRFGGALRA